MTWTDIFNGIGDAIEASFAIISGTQNKFNYLMIAFGFCALIYWLMKQHQFNKEAEKNGTLK
jgi:IS4 transposase